MCFEHCPQLEGPGGFFFPRLEGAPLDPPLVAFSIILLKTKQKPKRFSILFHLLARAAFTKKKKKKKSAHP